jgi:hypothetical protein
LSGLLHTGHGSPETTAGTTGHGGSDLRKDRVTRILPDPSGLACGSRVFWANGLWIRAPEFRRSSSIAGFQPQPPIMEDRSSLGSRVHRSELLGSAPSPDLLVSLCLSLDISLSISQVSLSLSISRHLPFSRCLRLSKKKEEQRTRRRKK